MEKVSAIYAKVRAKHPDRQLTSMKREDAA
jgi:hypothetical protein